LDASQLLQAEAGGAELGVYLNSYVLREMSLEVFK